MKYLIALFGFFTTSQGMLYLQEQSFYNRGSNEGKFEFPKNLAKFASTLKNLDEGTTVPLPIALDKETVNALVDLLRNADKKILPITPEASAQEKLKQETRGPVSYALLARQRPIMLNIATNLGIPGLVESLENYYVDWGKELKMHMYFVDATGQKKLLIPQVILDRILGKIVDTALRTLSCQGKLNLSPEKELILKEKTKTLDQALFLKEFSFFVKQGRGDTVFAFLKSYPDYKEPFLTFDTETRRILADEEEIKRIEADIPTTLLQGASPLKPPTASQSTPIPAVSEQQKGSPLADKKIFLQNKDLFEQKSAEGLIPFPYDFVKYTSLKHLNPKENSIVPTTITPATIQNIISILKKAHNNILPYDSEEIVRSKIEKEAQLSSYLLKDSEFLALMNAAESLAIEGILNALIGNYVSLGSKSLLFTINPQTNQRELLVSQPTVKKIINKILDTAFKNSEKWNWTPAIQEIIRGETTTIDQAYFIESFANFLRRDAVEDMTGFLQKAPEKYLQIPETFSATLTNVLRDTYNKQVREFRLGELEYRRKRYLEQLER